MNLARAQRAIGPLVEAAPKLAVLALLVLAGWLAARWVLYFAAPVEVPTVPGHERVQLGVAAQALSDAHVFGAASAGAGSPATSNLNIKLKGVFASRADAPGMAIVNSGDRDATARVGSEIVPGVVLEAVHPQYVMLRRNGSLERVNLEEPQRTAVAPAPRAPPGRAPPGRAAQQSSPAPQPGIETPAPAPAQSAPGASQGLMIQSVPPGSLLERIGLQPGDVVRTVNGEGVSSEADVARILQSLGPQATLTAEVQRGNATIPIAVNPLR